VIVPYVTNQPTVATLGMTAGSQTWLASYKRTGLMSFRPMSATGVMGTEVQFQSTGYGAYDTAAVSFDRANFLVVPSAYGTSLAGYRVTQGGANLDATPIALTPTDTAMESKPAIGSDGAGRHLVGYVKSTDGRVYARTFSTCPAP
jgi:hypothetical protein